MKTQELVQKDNPELIVKDLQNTQKMCQALMATPHYRKMGAEGIFAIVEKSRSVGINPMDALNGGMYFVQGKVEMTSALMNQLIRSNGHSVTKDKKSDDTICILHGKRADNNDTWVESFSIADAQKAGIYRNQWLKYPKDMLFARALSRLGRQLFPDVIKGCYVQGEISDSVAFNTPIENEEPLKKSKEIIVDAFSHIEKVTDEEISHLDAMIGDDKPYRKCVMNFIKKQFGVDSLNDIPRTIYDKILPVATNKFEIRQAESLGFVYGEETQMAMEG